MSRSTLIPTPAMTKNRSRESAILWLFLAVVLLIMTGSRTGVLAALVGSLTALLMQFAGSNRRAMPVDGRSRMTTTVAALALVTSLGVVLLPTAEDLPVDSARWRKDYEGSVWEGFQASRGFLIERSLVGFSTSPLVGVGFGLSANPDDMGEISYLFGLPLGAPVEKGFAITALLEETGLVGSILFLALLWVLLRTIARSADPPIMGLAVAALATNFGESTLLSAGGMGLYIWLLLGVALSQGGTPNRAKAP